LSSDLFGEGFKPAVDVGLSVSRVGSRVQPPALRDLSKDLALDYIRYREMLKATRLRAAISDDLAKRLRHGEKLERIFIQDIYPGNGSRLEPDHHDPKRDDQEEGQDGVEGE